MGVTEYKNYVNDSLSFINDESVNLYEAMMDREDDEVLKICDALIEKLNLIKEYHTDETLL